MLHLKQSLIIFTSCLLIGLIKVDAQTANPNAQTSLNLTGIYECPDYHNKDNKWNAHKIQIEQKEILGTALILEKQLGTELTDKVGPYTLNVTVADGLERFSEFYRKSKVYPIKTKSWITEGKLYWEATYPAYTDNSGKKRKSSKGFGRRYLDAEGHLANEGSHFTGTYTCKKSASAKL